MRDSFSIFVHYLQGVTEPSNLLAGGIDTLILNTSTLCCVEFVNNHLWQTWKNLFLPSGQNRQKNNLKACVFV